MTCPQCRSARVYPSRLRNLWERMRQALTGQQLYRCHECGWRSWADVGFRREDGDVAPEDLRLGPEPRPVAPAEVDRLDPA